MAVALERARNALGGTVLAGVQNEQGENWQTSEAADRSGLTTSA